MLSKYTNSMSETFGIQSFTPKESFRKISTKLAFFCFFIFSAFLVTAQDGTIRGYIFDKSTGDPVMFGTVFLEGTEKGVNSDLNGFYIMTGIKAGEYRLVATYIGYDSTSVDVKVSPGSIQTISLYLEEGGVTLGTIDISAARSSAKTEIQVSQLTITPKQIKALPSIGGDADILQYLQILPGIISTGDQGGQIFIRGGSPVQNKILLDGLNIYNPFHSIGFYSVFETELIRRADVLTGGFGAEHGGRISAVVDIKTRDGNKIRNSGQVSVSPFMGKVLFEGPLSKFREGEGSSSVVFSAKRSFIDRTSRNLYSYAAQDEEVGLPFEFTDLYGKVSFNNANGSKVSLFGFNFTDNFNNPRVASIGWDNFGVGANFSLIPTNSEILVSGNAGYTKYSVGIDEAEIDDRFSSISEFGANIDFAFFGENNEFNYGVDLRSIGTEFLFNNPFGLRLNENQNSTEFSGYFKYRQIFGNLVLEPSIRLMYYASQGVFSPEPRIGMKYNIADRLRFKSAAGIYSQNILSTDTERDVVNLFFGFLTGPTSRVVGFDGQTISNRIQKSRHLIGGFEYDLGDNIVLNLEGYFKDFPQLVVVNRNKIDPQDANYALETGEAYGIDFSLKYETNKLYIWSTYSYGFVNRFDGRQSFPTVFDRRHNVNFLASYALDKKGDFQVSIRWNMGSGFPFTRTSGFFNQQNFVDGVNTDFLTNNPDNIGIIFSEQRNGGRLPYYHRLDLSANKKFILSKYTSLELVMSVTNAYNRDNIFYFDRVRYERVDQLPIIPSLGVKFLF
jgi:hypothetical protein